MESTFPHGGERREGRTDDRACQRSSDRRSSRPRADWGVGLGRRLKDLKADVLAILPGDFRPDLGHKGGAGEVDDARRFFRVGVVDFDRDSKLSRCGDRLEPSIEGAHRQASVSGNRCCEWARANL